MEDKFIVMNSSMKINMDKPQYVCEKHGIVENWVQVSWGGDNDGLYCQQCYVENIIIPNCLPLKEIK